MDRTGEQTKDTEADGCGIVEKNPVLGRDLDIVSQGTRRTTARQGKEKITSGRLRALLGFYGWKKRADYLVYDPHLNAASRFGVG